MNKRSGSKIISNIVLSVILIILLLLLLGIVLNVRDELRYAAEGDYSTDHLEVSGQIQVEKLGDVYEGNSEQGYTFYKIVVPVTNTGTAPGYSLSHYIHGDEYYVKEYDYYYNDFYWESRENIPPAADGILDWVIQVKDGVTEIDLKIFQEQDGELQGADYNLQLPREM